MKKIAQGAEAVIFEEKRRVLKHRVEKGYRISEIDLMLRKRRTRSEAKMLREARRHGIDTPQILEESDFDITMEKIDGRKLRDVFDRGWKKHSENIGKIAATLHRNDMIHGDLTTSNMILKDGKIFLIDFGLGYISKREEDKAVDLYLLRRSLQSTHFKVAEKAWDMLLKVYQKDYPESKRIISRLVEIQRRGRYTEK